MKGAKGDIVPIRDGFHVSKLLGGLGGLLVALGVLPFSALIVGLLLFIIAADLVIR